VNLGDLSLLTAEPETRLRESGENQQVSAHFERTRTPFQEFGVKVQTRENETCPCPFSAQAKVAQILGRLNPDFADSSRNDRTCSLPFFSSHV
jgi:hypothetical protein